MPSPVAPAAQAASASPARSARDRILDAFEDLLAEQSERAATLEAVAARAGVSKGGLLYHFASKDALVDGLLERFSADLALDVERMRAAPDGPVSYFLRTSIPSDNRLERVIVAIARLAQASDARAGDALADQEARRALPARGWPRGARPAPAQGAALIPLEKCSQKLMDPLGSRTRRGAARLDNVGSRVTPRPELCGRGGSLFSLDLRRLRRFDGR